MAIEYSWCLSLYFNLVSLIFVTLDVSKKATFGNKLVNMPMSEVIYLLTTFANMASARTNKETDFVEFITTEVYEVRIMFVI